MSPVLHVLKDKSAYLLFGSGGETVSGRLYIISLPDFYDYIHSDLSNGRPIFKGSYKNDLNIKFKEFHEIKGLYSLYDSDSKGIMVLLFLLIYIFQKKKKYNLKKFLGTTYPC